MTGRPRRCGWLDIPAVRLAVRLSGIESLALTKLDVMAGLERVKLCVGYRLGGRTLDEMPVDLDDLAAAEPLYEELDGWPEAPAGDRTACRAGRRGAFRRAGSSALAGFRSGRPPGAPADRRPWSRQIRSPLSGVVRKIVAV